jgi:hypothetical protein
MFSMISRKTWDDTRNPDPNNVNYRPGPIIVHHSVYPRIENPTYSQALARVRQIDRLHESQGWGGGLGYSVIVVGQFVFEGRLNDPGAHTVGYNTLYPAVCLDGNFERYRPNAVEQDALVWVAKELGRESFTGHRDYNSTGCPGQYLYSMLPKLTERIEDTAVEPVYFFEELDFLSGGIGPKFLGGWSTTEARQSVQSRIAIPDGAHLTTAQFDRPAPYGLILWPPNRHGMGNPRWAFDTKEDRDRAATKHEERTGRKVRRFKGLGNSIYKR